MDSMCSRSGAPPLNVRRTPPGKERPRSIAFFYFRCPRESGIWNGRSTNLRRGAQVLGEERERATPGEIGGRFVVARAAGVVVEGVLRARIDVLGVLLVVGLERGLERLDAFVDVVVVLGILQQQWRLDPRNLVGRRLRAVIGDAGSEVRTVGRHAVYDAAAEAEADRADLAG